MTSNYINEFRPAVPAKSEEAILKTALIDMHKALDQIYKYVASEPLNRELLKRLKDAGGTVQSKLSIEYYPGLSIPLYIKLIKPGDPLGSFGTRRDWLITPLKARLTLGVAIDKQDPSLLAWHDKYENVLQHEVVHLVQAVSVTVRYLRMNNIEINAKNIDKWLPKIASKSNTGQFLKGIDKQDDANKLEKRLKYSSSRPEIGANAHVLLDFLVRRNGTDVVQQLKSCLDYNEPTFEQVDQAITDQDRTNKTIWGSYTKLIEDEMRIRGIRSERWTTGYKLKKEILKVAVDIYYRFYNK